MSSSSIPQVHLASHDVGKVGFGLMQLTWTPQPVPDEEAFAAMKAAADAGATAWSSATFYGPPDDPYANVKLIRRFFDKYPEYSRKITILLKGGLMPVPSLAPIPTDKMEDRLREEMGKSIEILGKERGIDVFVLARMHPESEIEDLAKIFKKLQGEGLFGAVGVSEMKADTVEKASKIIDVACLEIEVSLWSYDQTVKEALSYCASNKIPVLCYSPLGRGFLTRKYKSPEDIPEGSFIKHAPRFQGESFYKNLELVDKLDELAQEKGTSTGALALAWIVGLNGVTIPIPGSSKPDRAKDNTQAGAITLSENELEGINKLLAEFEPAGGRYPDGAEAILMR